MAAATLTATTRTSTTSEDGNDSSGQRSCRESLKRRGRGAVPPFAHEVPGPPDSTALLCSQWCFRRDRFQQRQHHHLEQQRHERLDPPQQQRERRRQRECRHKHEQPHQRRQQRQHREPGRHDFMQPELSWAALRRHMLGAPGGTLRQAICKAGASLRMRVAAGGCGAAGLLRCVARGRTPHDAPAIKKGHHGAPFRAGMPAALSGWPG